MLKVLLVNNEFTRKEFLEFPQRLMKSDPNYIRPLDKDIEGVFDSKTNKALRHSEFQRVIFQDTNGKTVGKVAVFINPSYKQDIPTGGFGFFDCINDQATANFIFDYCKNWLSEKGMQAMDGPINLGERDKFWGLLMEGRSEPLYNMNFNPDYYGDLFKNYGLEIYFNQLCFGRSIHAEISPVFTENHKKYINHPTISARPMHKSQLEKYAKDFTEIYNQAWASHGEGKQLELGKAIKMFRSMKPIINNHISWFVYDNEKPIAFWINIPDVNQWFKFLNGKFGILSKLKFLWLKMFQKNTKMIGVVFGVIPEWQGKGIDGFMICEGTTHIRKHTHFRDTELQWIGDFNPKMIRIAENLDTEVTRKLATFRYLFDRNLKFERHPIL